MYSFTGRMLCGSRARWSGKVVLALSQWPGYGRPSANPPFARREGGAFYPTGPRRREDGARVAHPPTMEGCDYSDRSLQKERPTSAG